MKYNKFKILKEIDEWRREIDRLEKSDQDKSEQITEIRKRIDNLILALNESE